MIDFGPEYQEGHLSIESADVIKRLDLSNVHVGVQLAADGRIWVCVNGLAYLRFKPSYGQRYANIAMAEHPLSPTDEDTIHELLR